MLYAYSFNTCNLKKKLAATTWLTLAKNAKSLINENTTYNCTFCNIV